VKISIDEMCCFKIVLIPVAQSVEFGANSAKVMGLIHRDYYKNVYFEYNVSHLWIKSGKCVEVM